ncbi:hypothetical protein EJ08DRAFT_678054 [Tothia fuscella]|uniref:Uncharacterized protein n=1 Tax=Tothia fuscella TaxID=1048955 RepID=A0A9P4NTH3_9PEZI|nr:hypothetical protein EJ08DRAFT_678054 [Tothia fuscella]
MVSSRKSPAIINPSRRNRATMQPTPTNTPVVHATLPMHSGPPPRAPAIAPTVAAPIVAPAAPAPPMFFTLTDRTVMKRKRASTPDSGDEEGVTKGKKHHYEVTASADLVTTYSSPAGVVNKTRVPTVEAYCNPNDLSHHLMGFEATETSLPPSTSKYVYFKVLMESERDFDGQYIEAVVPEIEFEELAQVAGARVVLVKDGEGGIPASTIFEHYLQVPTIWSPKGRQNVREAAKRVIDLLASQGNSGLSNYKISILNESHAAALHVLNTKEFKQSGLKVGDVFMVGDLGGATVDYGTYVLLKNGEIDEWSTAGAQCGGEVITSHYHDWLKETFGTAYTNLSAFERQGVSIAFNEAKERFDPDKNYNYVKVQHALADDGTQHGLYSRRRQCVEFPSYKMLGFYRKSLDNIDQATSVLQDLTHKSFAKSCKKDRRIKLLFLTGGYNTSKHLRTELTRFCTTLPVPMKAVFIRDKPEMAVALGAARYKYQGIGRELSSWTASDHISPGSKNGTLSFACLLP